MAKPTLKQRVAKLGLRGRIALLVATFAALAFLSIPVALALSGPNGLWASFAAAAVVGFASIVGMIGGAMFHGPQEAVTKLVFGMMVRMSIPLVACLLVLISGSPLVNWGFVFYVLAFYLGALPIDALLSMAQSSEQQAAGSI